MRYMTIVALYMAMGTIGSSQAAEEHALLSSPLSGMHDRQLQAITVTYAPGQSSAPHRHGGDIFAYVLSGHVRSQLAGDALHVYGPGDSWFEPAGAHHVVSGNASMTEPATFLVVFVAPAKAPLTSFDKPLSTRRP